MNIAIIVFGGVGSRISSNIPKQFIKINGIELVVHTIRRFQDCKEIDEIVLVTNKDYIDLTKSLVNSYSINKVKHIILGGSTRQESARNALKETNYKDDDIVLIHDGDRPMVDSSIIINNINALKSHDVVCTYIKHIDSLKEVSNSGRKKIVGNIEYDIQTPQSFRYGLVKTAHMNSNKEVNDDISLLEDKYPVYYVLGSKYNFKVTKDEDLEYLKIVL